MTTATAAQATALQQRIAADPRFWYEDILGWRPTPAARRHGITSALTPDQWAIIQSIQTHRRTGVASGHTIGKTWVLGGEVLRFIYGHPRSIVVTTGPGATQVEELLWRDIRKIYAASRTPLGGRLLLTKLELPDGSFAIGLAPAVGQQEEQATKMQGFHAPYVMVVIDEAVGVEAPIFKAAEAITTGAEDRIVACCNPTDPTCAMKREWDSGRWHTLVMSGRNHPNVIHDDPGIIPGAITTGWIADHASDPLACAIIDGLWPATGQHGLIPEAWVRLAEARWTELAARGDWAPVRAVGLDVGAGTGGDASTIARLCGWAIRDIGATTDEDTQATEGRVIAACRSNGPDGPWPLVVADAIGVGVGVVDQLRADGWPVWPFVAGATAVYPGSNPPLPIRDKTGTWGFADCRAAAWWLLRELLDPASGVPLALPPDDELRAELTALHFFPVAGGRYRVESKHEVRKRLNRSTDKADAVIHALWSTLVVEQQLESRAVPVALSPWDPYPVGQLGGW